MSRDEARQELAAPCAPQGAAAVGCSDASPTGPAAGTGALPDPLPAAFWDGRRNGEFLEWDAEADAALSAYWAAGLSSAAIARLMRIPAGKNRIIGRARRIGLAQRPSPIRRRAEGAAKPSPLPKPKRPPAAAILAAAAPQAFLPLRILSAVPRRIVTPGPPAARTCRFPLWGNNERPTHLYCGKPCRDVGVSYCADCCKRVFVKPRERAAL